MKQSASHLFAAATVATVTKRIKVAPGRPGTVKLKFTVPAGLLAGTYTLSVRYGGSTNYAGSVATVRITVTK